MLFLTCYKLAKTPGLAGVIRGLHKASHNALSKVSDTPYEEAAKRVRDAHQKPIGTTIWSEQIGGHRDLSIIVPFFKNERFARRCIDSILVQTEKYDLDIILVDDGSPDRCGAILDSYAHHENVTVIHQKNAGVSVARNNGLLAAQGEYVMFVDSDDILLPGAVNKLMDTARRYDADIVEGGHHIFTDRRIRREIRHELSVGEHGQGMFGYPWGKVIRSSLFNDVCFPEGYWHQDTIISYLIYPKAGVTVRIPELVVGYYTNDDGITAQSLARPKSIDTLYVVELILGEMKLRGTVLTDHLKRGSVHQLSSILFFRTRALPSQTQEMVFLYAAQLVQKYGLCNFEPSNYIEKELIEAFQKHQYKRWKWASVFL